MAFTGPAICIGFDRQISCSEWLKPEAIFHSHDSLRATATALENFESQEII